VRLRPQSCTSTCKKEVESATSMGLKTVCLGGEAEGGYELGAEGFEAAAAVVQLYL
jgi:hypothetical protein